MEQIAERASTPISPNAAALTPQSPTELREFLSFKLGTEEYGIDILRVRVEPVEAQAGAGELIPV